MVSLKLYYLLLQVDQLGCSHWMPCSFSWRIITCSSNSFSCLVCSERTLCLSSGYPSFYTRLYAFLDRDVLHLKHRSRFFRLTELFLSSTYADAFLQRFLFVLTNSSFLFLFRHLPSTLLAPFVKKLSRLSLTAPPAAIVMVIPFTYNILKRHPALMVMIHRIDVETENGKLRFSLTCLLGLQKFLFFLTPSWMMRKILCRHELWIVRIIMLLYLRCARSSPGRLRNRDMQWKISWTIHIIRYVSSSSSQTRYFKCSWFFKTVVRNWD